MPVWFVVFYLQIQTSTTREMTTIIPNKRVIKFDLFMRNFPRYSPRTFINKSCGQHGNSPHQFCPTGYNPLRPVSIEVLAIKAAQQVKLGLTNYWSTWRVLILLFPIPLHFYLRVIARFIPDAPTAGMANVDTQLAQRTCAPPTKSSKSVAIWLIGSTLLVGLTPRFRNFLKNLSI